MSDLTKEQIKGPDKFQRFSRGVVTWIENNSQMVLIVAGLFLVGGLAYAAYDFYQSQQEDKARVALYDAQRIRQELQQKQQDQKQKEAEAAAKKDEKKTAKKDNKETEPETADLKPEEVKQMKTEALTAYQKVIKEFPGTASSHIAVLQSSQMLLDEGRADEAQQIFEQSKEPSRGRAVLLGAFLNQKGKVLAEKGDCESAIKTWQQVYSDPKLTLWHGDSLVKAGICHEKLQQKDKAVELYKKASSEYGDTDAGRSAKKFLILAERPEPKG